MHFSFRLAAAVVSTAALTCVAPAHAGVVFTFAKSFGAPTIPLNGSTTLEFQVQRLVGSPVTGLEFLDPLPAGLVVSTPNGLAQTCGGTVNAVPGSSSVALTGGALAGGATCSVQVSVTGTTPGVKNNVTSGLNSSGGSAPAATASLTVLAASAASVPTLSEWALLLLTSLVAGSAIVKSRRRANKS